MAIDVDSSSLQLNWHNQMFGWLNLRSMATRFCIHKIIYFMSAFIAVVLTARWSLRRPQTTKSGVWRRVDCVDHVHIHRAPMWLASTGWFIEQCFTSPPTQYRLYGRRFLQVKRPNQQYHWCRVAQHNSHTARQTLLLVSQIKVTVRIQQKDDNETIQCGICMHLHV